MTLALDHSRATARFNQVMRRVPEQTRFAAAVALTRTAQDAQKEVRRQLPSRFTIRTGWVAKGIRVKMARKNNLESVVWVKDWFMTIQNGRRVYAMEISPVYVDVAVERFQRVTGKIVYLDGSGGKSFEDVAEKRGISLSS